MNKNKLISIILSACVLSTNSNFVVMAGTTNNSENIKSEGAAFVSGSDGIISDYTNILSEANLIFRASNVGNSQIDLSDYIGECRNLTSATIIVRFRVPEELENGERSLIKFKNSTSESENSFSVFFEKQSSTQGRFGYHCMINGTESPTGQRFSNVDYNTSGYNTLVLSITEGEGYATSLNNVKNYTSTAGNSIKFLNSISGLDTITTGDIDIAYIEVYNQKINEVEASRIANVNINDDNGLEKIDTIEVVKFNSEHKVQSVTDSTKEGNASFAVDRNFATHWHTDWNGSSPSPAGPHYITLDLGKEEVIDILEYLPRQDSGDGSGNGTITGYKVYASNSIPEGDITIEGGEVTNEGFIKIGEGSLENSSSIKLIDVKDIKARYVTLVSTSGHNGFASASEIYVNRGIELPSPSVSTVNVKEDTLTNNSVTLNWSIDEESDEYIDKYVLYFNDNVREPIELSKETLEYTIDNLEGNREYTFEIAAINTQNIESERKSITIKTLKNELGMEGFDVQGSMETGTTHTIIPIGVGGAGVTYTYSVYNTITGWNTLESNTTKSKLDWTPSIIGSHLVRVEVKDINGKVVRSDKWINFDNSSLTIEDMIISENIQAGTEVIINPVGDKTDSTKYTLEVYNTTEGWKTIASDVVSDEDGNVNLHWTPSKLGSNLVRITAKDDTTKVVRYDKWVTVNNESLSLAGFSTDGDLQAGATEKITLNGNINLALEESTSYKLEVYNTTQGWKTIDTYSEAVDEAMDEVVFDWIPEKIGNNLVRISATDSSGKTVRYDEWVTVNNDTLILKDFEIVGDLQVGSSQEITLDGSINIELEGSTSYILEIYNTAQGWKQVQSIGEIENGEMDDVTFNWIPERVGQNLVRVTVKDSSGKIVRHDKWITINNDTLSLTGIETDGDLQVENGETIKVNGSINSSLIDSTKYKLEVYNTTQGWKTISDYESMPFGSVEFNWIPEIYGNNLIRVSTTDNSGKIARYDEWVDVKYDAFTLKDIAIYNNDYSDISSDLEIGEEYIVVGLDEYGNWAKYGQYQDGKYDYSWEVYNTTYGWQEFGDYNGDQALTTYRDDVKFVEGSNLIRLTIKSKSGKVVKAEKWVTIKNSALTLTGIETDGDLQVGSEETIKVNGTINSKLMDSTKYKLEVYNTTQGWKTISDYESMPFENVEFNWIPETYGKNLIRVTVTDRSGKVARYDEWVDVTLDVISPETNPAEDNWLSEEIARQVGKEDYTTLTQEDFDSITRIDISNKGLIEVPSQIKYVKNLKNLYLDSNSISELPSELFQLSQLEILYLGDNNISIIPNEIGNLTNLKKLILFENPLTELPEEIGNLSDLSYLHLLYTGLENLPENIGQLSNLKELHLAGCEISGLPSSIGNLNNLQVLDLGNNNITNVVPEIGNLTSLKKLHLGGNNISDLPESMGNLVNLEKLYLSDNVGIKNLPESFKNLSKLTYLELLLTGITSINGISQEIRDVIGDENIKINFWDGISPWSLKSKTLSKNMHVITF
ncbi:discoidin domain-containing protein [Clostridium celatum]|uniref:leucine-rich repeat domain-containing protein n=1 Tax=Clostridium celatum TaxID=36834 RepID=UPI002903C39E|nr:discoidin domain-containing protein [Clostridium celatum]MDU2265550.1 leucine-rich repeat domain-containing protein [Clostridium celatum]MDU6295296.1 leucine-rich repeat domain-containing protein [Clostridium celatum]